ncbi:MAG: hypothetical protein IJ188_06360 [Clostridia bacterium]|nr:hypothetical protein [Clostridia bacterium]
MGRYVITNQPEDIEWGNSLYFVPRTIQNAKNLIMTQMGEVPYDRLRGFDPALYHLPMDKMRAALKPEIDRVLTWEPDATAEEVKAEMDEKGEILITVVIQVPD